MSGLGSVCSSSTTTAPSCPTTPSHRSSPFPSPLKESRHHPAAPHTLSCLVCCVYICVQLAAPSAEVVSSLEALCEDPSNLVFVISGRKKDDLHEWLGHIPRLGRDTDILYYKHYTPSPPPPHPCLLPFVRRLVGGEWVLVSSAVGAGDGPLVHVRPSPRLVPLPPLSHRRGPASPVQQQQLGTIAGNHTTQGSVVLSQSMEPESCVVLCCCVVLGEHCQGESHRGPCPQRPPAAPPPPRRPGRRRARRRRRR